MNKLREKLIEHEGRVFSSIFGTAAAVLLIFAVASSDESYVIDPNRPVTVIDLEENETYKVEDDTYINGTYIGKRVVVEPFIEVKQCDLVDTSSCGTEILPLPDNHIGLISVGDSVDISDFITE